MASWTVYAATWDSGGLDDGRAQARQVIDEIAGSGRPKCARACSQGKGATVQAGFRVASEPAARMRCKPTRTDSTISSGFRLSSMLRGASRRGRGGLPRFRRERAEIAGQTRDQPFWVDLEAGRR
jgi:hypothetical protein